MIKLAVTKLVTTVRLVVSVVVSLLASALVGSVCLGLLIGLPNEFLAIVSIHFSLASVSALIVGTLLFCALKISKTPLASMACLLCGVIVACVPLLFSIVTDLIRSGDLSSKDVHEIQRYAFAVIISGAIGGIFFSLGARLLRFR